MYNILVTGKHTPCEVNLISKPELTCHSLHYYTINIHKTYLIYYNCTKTV